LNSTKKKLQNIERELEVTSMKLSNNAKLVQKWKRRFYRQQVNLQKAENLVAELLCSMKIKNTHQGKSNYGDFKNIYFNSFSLYNRKQVVCD
jgi:hypothetical protein